METIKQGFEVKIVVFYQKYQNLVDLIKILQKILPRTLQTNSNIDFYDAIDVGNNLTVMNSAFTEILSKIAAREKISHVALPVSPLVFSSTFIQNLQTKIFEKGLMPHISLSGIDMELFDNANEIGLEKYVIKIEKMLRKKIGDLPNKKVSDRTINNILISKKTVKVKLNPNMLHQVLDTLQIKH